MLRKTKIICTLGPATDSPEMLKKLITAGANIFRLNMSHASHEWCRQVTKDIRAAATELDKDVSVLMDLRGPSIRTGDVSEPIELAVGEKFEFTMGEATAKEEKSVSVNYTGLGGDLKVGNTVLVDNGVIHMKVLSIDEERILCEVLTEGTMVSRRHINLPGIRVNLPALTNKDLKDLDVGVEIGADFIALSFARDAEHVQTLKDLLQEKNCPARVVSKVEDQEAVNHLDEIIIASDAVMVARGDLGIEVAFQDLPMIQRQIVKKCINLSRKVIVATHMLESMIENPVPTRAEVTDVANAIFEQADAIMLSGETSVGSYPIKCVNVFDKIARRLEEEPGLGFAEDTPLRTEKHKIVKSAVVLANSIPDAKIMVFTKHGIMAHYVAHFRPKYAQIFAFSPNLDVCRSLNMSRAVHPMLMNFSSNDPDATIEVATQRLRRLNLVEEGDPLVVLSDVLQGEFVVDAVLMKKA
ncbi:MAG: pyruvate kinase [Verrucomicrobiota bacterium]